MDLVSISVQIVGLASRLRKPDIILMIGVAVLILFTELLFFFVPGLSLSTLFIALSCAKFGFVPSLIIVLPPIIIAHFLILKNPSIVIGDTVALIVMLLFGVNAGPWIIDTFGWGVYGTLFGIVKWGSLVAMTFLYGGNMTKRVQNLALEPIFNFFIFWKLRMFFGFLL